MLKSFSRNFNWYSWGRSQLHKQLLNSPEKAIAVFDPVWRQGKLIDFRYRFCNPLARQVISVTTPDQQPIGKTINQLFPGNNRFTEYREAWLRNGAYVDEIYYDGAGVKGWFAVRFERLGRSWGLLTFRDITSLIDRLHTDDLTGLLNRRGIRAVPARSGYTAALYLDLDGFKSINDTQGHAAGDALLRLAANVIQKVLHPNDRVARDGGDEFAILLHQARHSDVPSIAERVANAIQSVGLKGSIGIAYGITPELTIRHADIAMVHAKKSANATRVAIFHPSMLERIEREANLLAELRKAIEEEQFLLHYQPIVALRPGYPMLGVEALIRWQHPVRGLLLPGEWMAVAESAGLMRAIGDWVIKAAIVQAIDWVGRMHHCVQVAVNLSEADLRSAELFERLGHYPIARKLCVFEVTERALNQENWSRDQIIAVLSKLRLYGKIGLDDFGSPGYSALGQLALHPWDVLKLDKGISALDTPKICKIARSTIDLAHELGMIVVAEGIESEYQLKRLEALGVDMGQGYYFARPMTAEQIEQRYSVRLEKGGDCGRS